MRSLLIFRQPGGWDVCEKTYALPVFFVIAVPGASPQNSPGWRNRQQGGDRRNENH
jgi:hypothetical protein